MSEKFRSKYKNFHNVFENVVSNWWSFRLGLDIMNLASDVRSLGPYEQVGIKGTLTCPYLVTGNRLALSLPSR